ncbi:SH3 domain-binding protein 1-like [Pseudopipra pipra]|uniref:SH3 domain-binding protein 1-like n=1 Tax=Pseudopipra pipra TaxID=415032 RepID=UPI0031397CE2
MVRLCFVCLFLNHDELKIHWQEGVQDEIASLLKEEDRGQNKVCQIYYVNYIVIATSLVVIRTFQLCSQAARGIPGETGNVCNHSDPSFRKLEAKGRRGTPRTPLAPSPQHSQVPGAGSALSSARSQGQHTPVLPVTPGHPIPARHLRTRAGRGVWLRACQRAGKGSRKRGKWEGDGSEGSVPGDGWGEAAGELGCAATPLAIKRRGRARSGRSGAAGRESGRSPAPLSPAPLSPAPLSPAPLSPAQQSPAQPSQAQPSRSEPGAVRALPGLSRPSASAARSQ